MKPDKHGAGQYDFFATAGGDLGGLEEGELKGFEGGLEVSIIFDPACTLAELLY